MAAVESLASQPSKPLPRARRGGISSESSAEQAALSQLPAGERIVVPKSAEANERIRNTLAHNILFAHLLPEQFQLVVDAMFEVQKSPGDYVIRQGEEGDNFYIVDSGTLDIFVRNAQGEEIRVLTVNSGGYFGELALMYNCPRAASVVATTPVVLWALDRATFRHILLDTTARKRRFYEGLLVNIPILAPLQKYEIFKVADELQQRQYENGEYIVRQGEAADGFYIVEEGEASVYKNPDSNEPVVELKRVKRGDYFGELALLTDKPRAANVVAQGPVTVAYMGCDAFNRLLGPCQELLRNNIHHYKRFYEPFLSEVSILASLTSSEIKQVADALVPVEFQPGDVIVKQGEPGDTFYIVESGEAIVTKKSGDNEEAVEVKRLSKGDYFGEVALLHTVPRAATVVAVSPMKCVKLNAASFNELLGSCKDILMRNTELYNLFVKPPSTSH